MKTNTNYLKMSQNTQQILQIIHSIFEKQLGRNDYQKISFDYTNSEPEYSEKILNLKCILGSGNFKIINYNNIFKDKTCEIFNENFRILFPETMEDYQIVDKQRKTILKYLFDRSTEKAEAKGVNFNDSVKNLFKKITKLQVIKSKNKLPNTHYPVFLIKKVGEEFPYFNLYIYDSNNKKFFEEPIGYKFS